MYYLKKTTEIAGAHNLKLDYESKCSLLHGHNWVISVYCKARELNKNGMVTDFTDIKKAVMSLDHRYINDVIPINPTAENIAKYLCEIIPNCYRVDVIESQNNEASYEKDEVSINPNNIILDRKI